MKGVGNPFCQRSAVPIAEQNMRLTKKAAALLVAATMVASMGTTAWATSTINTGSNTNAQAAKTTVKYTVNTAYTWTVPAEIDFTNGTASTSDSKRTATVESTTDTNTQVVVTKNFIENDKKLSIKVSRASDATTTNATAEANKKFYVATSAGATLDYTVAAKKNSVTNSDYADVSYGGEVLSVAPGTTDSASLKFTLTKDGENVEKAGTYLDLLVFTASVEDK